MVDLHQLNCVLEPIKDAVFNKLEELDSTQISEAALERLLGKANDPNRRYLLCKTSLYTFARLTGDAENIAPNLVS